MNPYKIKTHVHPKTDSRKPAETILASILRQTFKTNHPVLVAIGGPGGTGKSTFAGKLAAELQDAAVLSLDDYKTPRSDRRNLKISGTHPDANYITLLQKHLQLIRKAESFDRPVYDTLSGEVNQTTPYHPKKFNLLDGEISTYKQLREYVDFIIFIDSDWKTQLNTRISRDIEERQYTREKAIALFLQSNLREFQDFGAESKAWADVHLYCREDYHLIVESVSQEIFHQFELMLHKDLAEVDFSGLIIPVTTPFETSGKIDWSAFIRHLEYLADHCIKRILAAGTTGEFFSLLPEERRQLLTLSRRYFPGVVLFQTGAESLALTLEQIKWAEDGGADGILVLPPYYYSNATHEGLVRYFQEINKKTDLPLILYNFPKHTNLPFTPELLSEIQHFGLKDSSADLTLIGATSHYYLGGDAHILTAFQKGAYGLVSARANAYPELYIKMEQACKNTDWDHALDLQEQINRVIQKIGSPGQIQKVKRAVCSVLNTYPAGVRLPLLS